MSPDSSLPVVAEQISYYRQRASEYDDFWARSGRYALPPKRLRGWQADAQEAVDAVRAWNPGGDVLELACGTGLWTQHLAKTADRVSAVDAAPEMIAFNRARMERHPTVADTVTYTTADLFSWSPPPNCADGVFFGYWHSHVPDERLETFWRAVDLALRPGGTVMLVDSAPDPADPGGDQMARHERRRLDDGREFGIVKRYWSPQTLTDTLSSLGWQVRARTTTHSMILLADLQRRP